MINTIIKDFKNFSVEFSVEFNEYGDINLTMWLIDHFNNSKLISRISINSKYFVNYKSKPNQIGLIKDIMMFLYVYKIINSEEDEKAVDKIMILQEKFGADEGEFIVFLDSCSSFGEALIENFSMQDRDVFL